ncbi:hypothetical protein AAMO2058_001309800 [Amorphochlora amoebiformis]
MIIIIEPFSEANSYGYVTHSYFIKGSECEVNIPGEGIRVIQWVGYILMEKGEYWQYIDKEFHLQMLRSQQDFEMRKMERMQKLKDEGRKALVESVGSIMLQMYKMHIVI